MLRLLHDALTGSLSTLPYFTYLTLPRSLDDWASRKLHEWQHGFIYRALISASPCTDLRSGMSEELLDLKLLAFEISASVPWYVSVLSLGWVSCKLLPSLR